MKKFENINFHDFLEAKSKEIGVPQEKINAVMPRWDLGIEEGNNNIFTADMQSPVIKVKGVITTNFKTQEEYDTKSRLHEAGYDVEKVAFTVNKVTVYCVDRKQNIFNMTVEYKDTEERLIQGVYFSPVDLASYVKYMLDPLGLRLKPVVSSDEENEENKYYRTYEIYLYQNTPDGGTTEKLPFDKIKETPYIKDDKGNISLELTQDQKTFMREQNGALLINYDSTSNVLTGEKSLHELIVKGLEPNTPYYVQIRTRIDLYKGETALGKSVYSVFSKIHSFTTETKPVPPTTDEQVPPAPEKFFIDSQPSNTTVKLGWEESEFALNHKDNIYYEMLRSDGATMDEKDSSRMLGIEKVLGMSSRYKGFHTADQYIKTYKVNS